MPHRATFSFTHGMRRFTARSAFSLLLCCSGVLFLVYNSIAAQAMRRLAVQSKAAPGAARPTWTLGENVAWTDDIEPRYQTLTGATTHDGDRPERTSTPMDSRLRLIDKERRCWNMFGGRVCLWKPHFGLCSDALHLHLYLLQFPLLSRWPLLVLSPLGNISPI